MIVMKMRRNVPLLLILILSLISTDAFTILKTNNNRLSEAISSTSSTRTKSPSSSSSSSSSLQCICINCSRVTDCAAYHFVEEKHSQPHINHDPDFSPREGSPTIHVNIRTNREKDGEMGRLWSEHLEETHRAEEKAKVESGENVDAAVGGMDKLLGEEKYDFSVKTTYEYDVVACQDYVKDDGCWVRNMPEEIKLANPDFVPT